MELINFSALKIVSITMETFSSILEEIIQKNEHNIKNVGDFANKIEISAASLSRVKSDKAALTDNVIKKIFEYLATNNLEYANNIKERLEKVRPKQNMLEHSSGNVAIDSYAKLLKKLSQENSLLMVDNRDFPVSLDRYPYLDDLTVDAVNKGLNIAMFQPFGSRSNLIKRRNLLSEKSVSVAHDLYGNVDEIVNAYDYLIRLASRVNNLFWNFKNAIESKEKATGQKALGEIVLYEAAYHITSDENAPLEALPSVVAGGIMSKLFYASFLDLTTYKTKIYEWVSAQNDELFFLERSNETLNFNAVKLQFSPIPPYWEKYKRLPKTEKQLVEAYTEFGLEELFQEKELVKWETCSPISN
jgi:hypothetical protein